MVSGKCLHAMEGHQADVTAVALSSDGSRTVSSSLDTTVKVWNTNQTSRCTSACCYIPGTVLMKIFLSQVQGRADLYTLYWS